MSDQETQPTDTSRSMLHVGTGVGGGLFGFLAGFFTHRATELPIDALDWAIKNGVAGVALAVACVFAWVAWRVIQKNSRLEEKYARKVEDLMREHLSFAKKITKLLTICIEVLKGSHVSLDDLEAIEKDVENGDDPPSHTPPSSPPTHPSP